MKIFFPLAFGLVSLIFSEAYAWGPTGHRVVGQIAEKHLTPRALSKVNEILKGDGLAKVANWPDEIRSEPQTYSNTYVWHYTEWKDNSDDHAENQSTGLLLTAINNHLEILKSDSAKIEEKLMSLKFIVHLIGDLHQPFHVGNGFDRGGNNCKIVFFNNPTNLHKVWDEDMIDSSKLSFTEIASFVEQGLTPQGKESIQSGDFNSWAKESKDIRTIAYPAEVTPPTPIPLLQNISESKSYCGTTVPVELQPKISYDYNYRFMSTLHRRLLQGGLRLAMVLNQLFAEPIQQNKSRK